MKRIMAIVMALMMLAVAVYSQVTKKESTGQVITPAVMYGSDGTNLQRIKTDSAGRIYQGVSLSTRTTHRSGVTSNDTFAYASGDSAKLTCAGFRYALVEVDVGGTTPSWDVTPEFGDATASTYFKGQKRTVTQDERFIVEVDGETMLMIRLDGQSGTSPTASVYVTPFN